MEFEFLQPTDIQPKGWMLRQLQIQADGLNGNLDKIWPDVRDSKWLGGDREGWERLPYFLDGFIPLAYLLKDEDRIARANKYMDSLLSCQAEDGCFYPKGDDKNGDIWSLFLIFKVLTVYESFSKDERIEDALYRGLKFLDKYIDHTPPFNWAATRWYECIIPILWLKERRDEEWLTKLAHRLKALGTNFEGAVPLWKSVKNEWSYETHVVNIAMALKSEAVYTEATGEQPTGLTEKMLARLFETHGTAYGHFNGDECLSGNSPIQGSELCGVVEAMYSYEWLTMVTGNAKWGDLLESLAFNGLPAAVSEDMWTHQYDQQVNQIACTDFANPVFHTNGPQSNMFGLEPHFGCCTSNFGQGFPKFMTAAYAREDDALVVVSPLPAEVKLNSNKIVCQSEYPFRKKFTLTAEKDVTLKIRVPAWAKAKCSQKGKEKDGWLTVKAIGGKPVTVEFPAKAKLVERPEGRKCVKYGNLLFSLPIQAEKKMFEYERDGVERKFPYCDYSFEPVGEWRYAFASDKFEVIECEYENAFSRANPPLKIKATLAPVEWGYEEGHELVAAKKVGTKRVGENVTKELQPYGATYLRVTEMALIK